MLKKRILIFPFDLMSHYLRCITLAQNYKEYDILFAHSDKYDVFVKKAGFGSFKVETFNSQEVMNCAGKFDFSWLNLNSIENIFLAQKQVIKDYKPYMVIGDTSPTLKMAAEILGVKYISLMNGYMTRFYAHVRPVSRNHYSYQYVSKLPPKIADTITAFAERMAFKQIHKPFRNIRKKYGLRNITDYLSELEGDENLICDEIYLFPQKNLPKNYKVIGPLLFSSKQDELPLLAQLDQTKPTICVCLGSSGNIKALSFLSEKEYSCVNIIVAGDQEQVINGNHVYHKDFVNLEKILPRCSFLICHGGNGTIYEALRHKTYMLCLTSHFEQEWNVKRIEQLNLGILIDDSPQELINKQLELVVQNKKAIVL
ncbi:MAG: glycosyltransferase [Bacteroidota bacterium]|nr:glycosyltransferase [Bacteroidota bacterium]